MGWVAVGNACWDKQATDAAQWTVTDSSATWDETAAQGYTVSFSYSMPSEIMATGASVSLSVTGNDISNGAGIDSRICVFQSSTTFEIKEGGDQCATALAPSPGMSKTASVSFTLLPSSAAGAGVQVPVSISLGDGGNLYYTYRSGSSTGGSSGGSGGAGSGGGSGSSGGSGPGTVTVASISGEVAVRTGNGQWQPLTPGTRLAANQELFTGIDSHVTVTFENGSTMRIGELTQILAGTLQQKGKRNDIEVQLVIGAIKATVKHEISLDTSFKIRTATASAGVRGSAMSVFYDPSSRLEIVGVLSDRAYLQPRGSTKVITIPQGEEVAITPSGVSRLAPIGKADARGGIDAQTAWDLVLAAVGKTSATCGLTSPMTPFGVKPAGATAWQVTIPVAGKVTGPAAWTVNNGKVAPANTAADTITAGC